MATVPCTEVSNSCTPRFCRPGSGTEDPDIICVSYLPPQVETTHSDQVAVRHTTSYHSAVQTASGGLATISEIVFSVLRLLSIVVLVHACYHTVWVDC